MAIGGRKLARTMKIFAWIWTVVMRFLRLIYLFNELRIDHEVFWMARLLYHGSMVEFDALLLV